MSLDQLDTRPPTTGRVNVAADLAERAERLGWAGRPAFHTDRRTWTHGEVHDLAARATSILVRRGVRPGDRVLLALPDGIGWVVAFLAVARLGAVAVLVNPELAADDHSFVTYDCAPVLCVTGAALQHRFEPSTWLDVERLLALAEVTERAHEQRVGARTPLYIQYTSGTTGEPKGVVHDHGHPPVYYNRIGRQVLEVTATDVTFSISKLFFAYGFGNALVFPLYSGSSAVLLERRPIADRVTELVARHGVTLLYGVPSAYAALVERGDADAFASLRGAVSAGETLPATLGQHTAELLGAPIYEQLGSTEAGHALCANSVRHNVPGTVGRPVPGFELELRDEAGAPVEGDGEGELWVRGPTVMREYLNRPADTDKALSGGWLRTRDLLRRHADGTHRHLGRVDDLEMVGGITVAPAEIERLLGEHPLVREVAVAAVTDGMGATKLRAFFVPAAQLADRSAVEAELMELARQRLAAFKVPRTVHAVPALPRTSTGKLRRHVVRTGAW
jgi:fatty acid CoA ligase FadD22